MYPLLMLSDLVFSIKWLVTERTWKISKWRFNDGKKMNTFLWYASSYGPESCLKNRMTYYMIHIHRACTLYATLDEPQG